MLNTSVIGTQVHFVDQNKLEVIQGTIKAVYQDEQTGFICTYIDVPTEAKEPERAKVEASLVFTSQELAQEKLTEITPLIEEARALDLDTRNKIDVIREKVIGKPLV